MPKRDAPAHVARARGSRPKGEPLAIGGVEVLPGERRTIEFPLPPLYTHTQLFMPVHVIHGRRPGPRLLVTAALHGDEINGTEIVRRLIRSPALKRIRGSLIAVPIVNVYGFINQSRYLPDRRDLNRSFPGSERGSLAARLANLMQTELLSCCTHGIDLHTAAVNRDNLSQVRACLTSFEAERMAHAFGAPVVLHSGLRDGSIRKAAHEAGVSMIVYEAGEALRFDKLSIRAGVRGVISVMRELEMLPPPKRTKRLQPTLAHASYWVRADQSGIARGLTPLGRQVARGEVLGVVTDPFGQNETEITARYGGVIIGRCNLPLVNEGEALIHIARFDDPDSAMAVVEEFQSEIDPEEEMESRDFL